MEANDHPEDDFKDATDSDLTGLRLDEYPDIALTGFLNVEYVHLKTSDGGDLYVTRHGLPFINLLKPESWYGRRWFKTHRERLPGTSTVYKVTTKKVNGKSIDLVVKWSRVGQDVPIETKIIEDVLKAEFNSPFEEISLVEELRSRQYGDAGVTILLQKPVGIYVPPEKLQLWQTGRSKHKIIKKIAKHPGVEIDILRQYLLIYKWVEGLNAVEAFEQVGLPAEELAAITRQAIHDLKKRGFRVLDQKPAHFIVRLKPPGIMKTKKNEIAYTLIDFELLERTPEHEAEVKASRRVKYLIKQRDRFKKDNDTMCPQHLHPVNIMGVDYIYGPTESTSGSLWVVGNDPDLFDYFQPERWRKTPRTSLSHNSAIYYTKTKDSINLVWKVSKVGERPDVVSDEQGQRILAYGFNSPFEEFAFAFAMSEKGIPTVYPRAIYVTGQTLEIIDYSTDGSRFKSHRKIVNPDGSPVLRKDHDYITLWGFWNGLDASLAEHDGEYFTGINALNAYRRGLISEQEYFILVQNAKQRLLDCGFESLWLKGNHILLSLSPRKELMRDGDGNLEIRLCNFELIKRMPS